VKYKGGIFLSRTEGAEAAETCFDWWLSMDVGYHCRIVIYLAQRAQRPQSPLPRHCMALKAQCNLRGGGCRWMLGYARCLVLPTFDVTLSIF
jgi:hypothetical protein